MPIVQIKINHRLTQNNTDGFLSDVASLISKEMLKPQEDVSVMYSYFDIWMANSNSPAAFMDIRFVSGLTTSIASNLCNKLGEILQNYIDIDLSRVYINFFDIPEEHAWRFKNGKAVCPPKKSNSEN